MNNAQKIKILVVDDEARVRKLMRRILVAEDYDIEEAADGPHAYTLANSYQPDMILLDVMMPKMNGFELAARLKNNERTREIPIIMVTALDDRQSRIRALSMGAEEFLTKPIEPNELQLRIRNLARLKQASDLVKNYNKTLENEVKQRTQQLRESFTESIFTLMRAAEYRDDETGAHVKRISHYCRYLSEETGQSAEFSEMVFHASPMHDIGKIGIPDHVLLKPGKHIPDEWKVMKSHTTIGYKILKDHPSPWLKAGAKIALCHHECWDGSGYPRGLAGEDIPLEARFMQICDVYDALRSKRPYKKAFDHHTTVKIITQGDGRTKPEHFDPDILSVFQSRANALDEIYSNLNDRNVDTIRSFFTEARQ